MKSEKSVVELLFCMGLALWIEDGQGHWLERDLAGNTMAVRNHSSSRSPKAQNLRTSHERIRALHATRPVEPHRASCRCRAAITRFPHSTGIGAFGPVERDGARTNVAASLLTESTGRLRLLIQPAGADAVEATLHNTIPGKTCRIVIRTDLTTKSWPEEAIEQGDNGQNETPSSGSIFRDP